jgi:hypothetical protein
MIIPASACPPIGLNCQKSAKLINIFISTNLLVIQPESGIALTALQIAQAAICFRKLLLEKNNSTAILAVASTMSLSPVLHSRCACLTRKIAHRINSPSSFQRATRSASCVLRYELYLYKYLLFILILRK